MLCSTIRDIIVHTAERLPEKEAIRYKKGKNEIEGKTYAQLKEDGEKFSAVPKTAIFGKYVLIKCMWVIYMKKDICAPRKKIDQKREGKRLPLSLILFKIQILHMVCALGVDSFLLLLPICFFGSA